MVRKIFRVALYTAAVLLVGQVPAAESTVGAQFLNAVRSGLTWIDVQLRSKKPIDTLRGIARQPAVRSFERAAERVAERAVERAAHTTERAPEIRVATNQIKVVPPPAPETLLDRPAHRSSDTEEVTASDQESLLRVLP